jgi:HK97 family phage portal protein
MWPFSRKASAPAAQRKSAAIMLGMGAYRSALNNAEYDKLAIEGYAANAVVNACINKVASAVASIEPVLYEKKGGSLKKIDSHPLIDLIESPNPAQSGKEFIRFLVQYYLLGGNAYIWGNGIDPLARKPSPPKELQLFNPGKMEVVPGPSLFPKAYKYKPSADPATVYTVDQVSGRSAVMQFKTFNPLNAWSGLPPMMAAAYGIDIFNGGQKWNKRLLDNDARPSGALVVKGADGKPATLGDEQFERVQAMIDSQFVGSENAGRPLLLEGGLEWTQMSMSAKDIDFLSGKHSSARDIGLVFGVPSQLLQIPGDSTFANYEQATLAFWTDTVIPLAGWIYEGLNRWLTPLYNEKNLYIWYDEESIPALEPRRKEKFARVQAAEFLTIDEKRRATGQDSFPHSLGKSLLLSGRGVLLGEDGSIVSLGIAANVEAVDDPLADDYTGTPDKTPADPAAPPQTPPQNPAKHRAWLESQGYTKERAERLTKLVYE